MLNLKLQTIASFIKEEDIVIDTCCDHAYLAIYLKKNNLCKDVYASDISKYALNGAINNIKRNNLSIKTFLSDGFKNIDEPQINTAVIAGVGTTTVLNIVNTCPQNIKKVIVSSNNEHYELRTKMQKLGFYLKEEKVIKENNKFYPIMLYLKTNKKVKKHIIKYGKSSNTEYFNYLLSKEKKILSQIPKKHIFEKIKHYNNIIHIKKILKERKLDYSH